jgi:hypothetical protein
VDSTCAEVALASSHESNDRLGPRKCDPLTSVDVLATDFPRYALHYDQGIENCKGESPSITASGIKPLGVALLPTAADRQHTRGRPQQASPDSETWPFGRDRSIFMRKKGDR